MHGLWQLTPPLWALETAERGDGGPSLSADTYSNSTVGRSEKSGSECDKTHNYNIVN